ncbi:MAG: hypothetical protein KGQ37_00570 [Hyphomicrobiales bacterium]|nr:hypothetical protein [Hyphomicrobiales bacterium]
MQTIMSPPSPPSGTSLSPDPGSARQLALAPHIEIGRRQVKIERPSEAGMVTIIVPTSAYRGVVLSLVMTGTGQYLYRTTLLHGDPDLCVSLFDHPERAIIETHWRRWAHMLGVPLLVERDPGCLELVHQKPKAATQVQRTHVLTLDRRGNFNRRRKAGQQHYMQTRHADQREIIARN